MKTNRLLAQASALLFAVISTSCATSYKPGTVQTASIETVKASPKMYFSTPAGSWAAVLGAATGGMGGIVVAVLADQAMKDRNEAMHQHLVAEIHRVLAEDVNKRGQFRVLSQGQAGEASITIKVELWGFRSGFTSKRVESICYLRLFMKDRRGKTIWSAVGHVRLRPEVLAAFPLKAHDPKAVAADPDLMRRELTLAIQRAVREITLSLPQGTASLSP